MKETNAHVLRLQERLAATNVVLFYKYIFHSLNHPFTVCTRLKKNQLLFALSPEKMNTVFGSYMSLPLSLRIHFRSFSSSILSKYGLGHRGGIDRMWYYGITEQRPRTQFCSIKTVSMGQIL